MSQVADFGACRAVTEEACAMLSESEGVLETMRNGDWKEETVEARENNALLNVLHNSSSEHVVAQACDRYVPYGIRAFHASIHFKHLLIKIIHLYSFIVNKN